MGYTGDNFEIIISWSVLNKSCIVLLYFITQWWKLMWRVI